MQGFGSELSLTAIFMIIAKVVVDIVMKWRERRQVVEIVNGNNRQKADGDNPGKVGGTSTNLMLYMLTEQAGKLDKVEGEVGKLSGEMTEVRIDVGKIKTKLEMK